MAKLAKIILVLVVFSANFSAVNLVLAQDLESANFKILAPVIDVGLGTSTSTNFILIGSLGETSTGRSTSSDTGVNQLKAGFLFFPGPAAAAPAPAPAPAPTPIGIVWPIPPTFPPGLLIPPIRPPFLPLPPICQKTDFNRDGRVNLVDVSIMLANWAESFRNPVVDLNNDGKIDIVDLSILLFCFSG